jgi:hypothetical protein
MPGGFARTSPKEVPPRSFPGASKQKPPLPPPDLEFIVGYELRAEPTDQRGIRPYRIERWIIDASF